MYLWAVVFIFFFNSFLLVYNRVMTRLVFLKCWRCLFLGDMTLVIFFINFLLWTGCLRTPQKSHVETITLNVIIFWDGAFGRWWGHEDQPLWWNSCPFEKKKRARAFSLSATWGQGEDGALWTSERVLPRTRPRWPRDLGLSASRPVRNKFLLFRSPGVRYFYYSSLKGLRHFFIHMRHDFYFS